MKSQTQCHIYTYSCSTKYQILNQTRKNTAKNWQQQSAENLFIRWHTPSQPA